MATDSLFHCELEKKKKCLSIYSSNMLGLYHVLPNSHRNQTSAIGNTCVRLLCHRVCTSVDITTTYYSKKNKSVAHQ